MSTQPPPLPGGPPPPGKNLPPPLTPPSGGGANSTYNLLADKVGGVPNIRVKDNLYQALGVFICCLLGAGAGWLFRPNSEESSATSWILLGLLGGMIVGVIVSGVVLMVIGWFRKS